MMRLLAPLTVSTSSLTNCCTSPRRERRRNTFSLRVSINERRCLTRFCMALIVSGEDSLHSDAVEVEAGKGGRDLSGTAPSTLCWGIVLGFVFELWLRWYVTCGRNKSNESEMATVESKSSPEKQSCIFITATAAMLLHWRRDQYIVYSIQCCI